jgi:hypothetical protein
MTLYEMAKNAKSPGNCILGLFRLRSQNKKTTSFVVIRYILTFEIEGFKFIS